MFTDRAQAGSALAAALHGYSRPNPLVLALPRGGLPVAEQVAQSLGAELDVIIVRKLGAPFDPEFAVGAVGEDGVVYVDQAAAARLGVSPHEIDRLTATQQHEVARRAAAYRHAAHAPELSNRNVVIVDDGLATGSTARAAVEVARLRGAAHVTVAIPVGSRQAVALLAASADDVVCLEVPADFGSVGAHYREFAQVSDEDALAIVARHPPLPRGDRRATLDSEVKVVVPGTSLAGHLAIPSRPRGIVVFAHGSGSDHASPRNASVAHCLASAGMGTLLVDLVAPHERAHEPTFDAEPTAHRLLAIVDWLSGVELARNRPVGLFGSSTGAAAALAAAALDPGRIATVVSRGGRIDLADRWLPLVECPTLLIVGGHDRAVFDLTTRARGLFTAPTLIEVVPAAGHLFQEPGALLQVSRLAQSWFVQQFAAVARADAA